MSAILPIKQYHESFPVEGDETLFKPWTPHGAEGMFQYHGNRCEEAIRGDSVPMVLEAIQRGWLEKDTQTLDGCGMVKHAKRCGAFAVAAKLVELGWQDEEWLHGITVGPKVGMDR